MLRAIRQAYARTAASIPTEGYGPSSRSRCSGKAIRQPSCSTCSIRSITADPPAVHRYKVEPYVAAADIYAIAPHIGCGGWTWYTGSAGWR